MHAVETAPQPPAPVPSGWFPDPWGVARARWWDGAHWTPHAWGPPADPPVARRLLGPGSVVVFAVCGLLAAAVAVWVQGAATPVAVVAALLPLPLYLRGVLALDRFRLLPRDAVVWGVCAGGLCAALVAWFVNSSVELALGLPRATTLVAVAPLVEESAKGLTVLLLARRLRRRLSGPLQGVVLAGLVGLGFAASEDVLFYAEALARGDLVPTFVARGVLLPFAHPLFTASTGAGLGLWSAGRTGRWAPCAGLGAAVALHALLNSLGSGGSGVLPLALVGTGLVVVAVLVRLEDRRIGLLVWRHLQPEVADGTLTAVEVQVLSRPGLVHRLRQEARDGCAPPLAELVQTCQALAEARRRGTDDVLALQDAVAPLARQLRAQLGRPRRPWEYALPVPFGVPVPV